MEVEKQRTLWQRIGKYKDLEMRVSLYALVRDVFRCSLFYIVHILTIKKRLQDKKRPLWIFCERGSDARDNAFVLFQYVCECHPEIDARYVMDEELRHSHDYVKVDAIGPVLHRRSLEHKISFLTADRIISTHMRGWVYPWSPRAISFLAKIMRFAPFVFLQHGVIKDDLRSRLGKEKVGFDLFICGAKPEYDYLLETMGYTEKEMKYTGLARYDHLHNRISEAEVILVMPTWREYAVQPTYLQVKKRDDQIFLSSEYFQRWNEFLASRELRVFLEENDMRILFYPHFEVQQYLKYFSGNDRVVMCDFENYDVQELLKTAKVLITDYSSVFFDFAYMRKPVIYYQFDEANFFDKHYKRGYFSYREHGFGDVTVTNKDVLESLKILKEQDFLMNSIYEERAEKFFPLRDTDNCKRIFHEISQMKRR